MKIIVIAQVLVCLLMLGMLIADKQDLRENLIRLHVVADSDSAFDQSVKLRVRDAVIDKLERELRDFANIDDAKKYLQTQLDTIEKVANDALRKAGSHHKASVTLCAEEFSLRNYDTFSLPSGIYQSLRVTIGTGQGRNWWCVVFPSLCVGAASDVQDTAVGAGFSSNLTNAITNEEGYEVSFFLLDCLGRLENFFHIG